ncbi:MAG: hypothetical protein EAZ98_03670 [Oscillatoriales cyanobacterium]|uniref:Uncharacterized protein n=1 Tax=Microcoleus anatoxicus PTRS2 TaxID=2705321 RepID=A0ABU8YVP9_9CYAN|nr:MAG: hypothetical protein EAZ98_03670 [Oscillatoriales cyanobacterium]
MKSNSAKANIAKNAIGLLLLLTESGPSFYANQETFFQNGRFPTRVRSYPVGNRPLVITYGIRPKFLRKSGNFFSKRAIPETGFFTKRRIPARRLGKNPVSFLRVRNSSNQLTKNQHSQSTLQSS